MEPLSNVGLLEASTSVFENSQLELEKSLALPGSAVPKHLTGRHRHWSTGSQSQLSSDSSSGSSLESLREKLEKSEYVVVKKKRLGVFAQKSRQRYLRRTTSEGDSQDLFGSTKALRDSFKTVSFKQGNELRRGSAPDVSPMSSPSASRSELASILRNADQSGTVSESESYSRPNLSSLIDKPRRGILKNSSSRSGSESSLNDDSSKENSIIVQTSIKKVALPAKFSAGNTSGSDSGKSVKSNKSKSGSMSPLSCFSRRNSKEKEKEEEEEERLYMVKTITKKVNDISQNPVSISISPPPPQFHVTEPPPSGGPVNSGGESAVGGGGGSGGSSSTTTTPRRSRYGMQNSNLKIPTSGRKISNCREEDEEEELRAEHGVKTLKKKRSRDEQRERRISNNVNRKEFDEKLAAMMSNARNDDLNGGGDGSTFTNNGYLINGHQQGGGEAGEHKDKVNQQQSSPTPDDGSAQEAVSTGSTFTSGIESGRSDEDLLGKRERLYKVLVVGELGTGKTSVIKRYVHQFFSQHYRATIGVDFALKVLRWDPETVVRLQLWDIAGQERFGSMTRVYYKEAVGAFVVFDVTRGATLEAVPKWKADLDSKVVLPDGRPIPTVLLANKCDQPREGIAANKEKMDEFCQQQGFTAWFETSAKDNTNIDEAANFLVSKILDIDRWSQEPMNSDPEKLELGSNGKHRIGGSSSCAC